MQTIYDGKKPFIDVNYLTKNFPRKVSSVFDFFNFLKNINFNHCVKLCHAPSVFIRFVLRAKSKDFWLEGSFCLWAEILISPSSAQLCTLGQLYYKLFRKNIVFPIWPKNFDFGAILKICKIWKIMTFRKIQYISCPSVFSSSRLLPFPLITRPLEAFIWILGSHMSNLEMKGKNSLLISLDD